MAIGANGPGVALRARAHETDILRHVEGRQNVSIAEGQDPAHHAAKSKQRPIASQQSDEPTSIRRRSFNYGPTIAKAGKCACFKLSGC